MNDDGVRDMDRMNARTARAGSIVEGRTFWNLHEAGPLVINDVATPIEAKCRARLLDAFSPVKSADFIAYFCRIENLDPGRAHALTEKEKTI